MKLTITAIIASLMMVACQGSGGGGKKTGLAALSKDSHFALNGIRGDIKRKRSDLAYEKLSRILYGNAKADERALKEKAEAWYWMGSLHLERNEYSKIKNAYEMAKKLDTKKPGEYGWSDEFARLLTKTSNQIYNSQSKKFNATISDKNMDKETRTSIFMGIRDTMQYALAITDTIDYYYTLSGLSKAEIGDSTAVMDLKKAVEIKPQNYRNQRQLADYYFNNQKYDAAITAYKKAQELKPDDFALLKYQGFSEQNAGKTKEAISTYEKYLALDSTDNYVRTNLVAMYWSEKDYQKCISTGNKVVQMEPETETQIYAIVINSYFSVFNDLNQQKKREEAKQLLTKVAAIVDGALETDKHRENGDMWKYAATIAEYLGDTKKAKKANQNAKKFGNG